MNNEINPLEKINCSLNNKSKRNRLSSCKLKSNIDINYKNIENNPQSPKIKNNEFRSNSQPKLFSLIDIKDKYHSKTTSLPNQYKRKIYNNIDKLLYQKNNNEIKKIPQIDYNLMKCHNKNRSTLTIYKKDEKEYIKKEKRLRKSKSQDNLDTKDYRIQSALISRKERLYKPNVWNNIDVMELNKKKRDKYMPEGFEFYEKKLKEFNKNYVKNNYILDIDTNNKENKNENKRMLMRKLNQLKQFQSDIFFMKEKEIKDEEKKSENDFKKKTYKYMDSDIFNFRENDPNIIGKSGERSYFRNLKNKEINENNENNKALSYNINNETLLGWKLRNPLPSLYNYTSSKFHLLNPNIKNIAKTKETVFDESKKISDNYNPIHKQKSLCEFIDLCHVSAPKINQDYNKAINSNPKVFRKVNETSSELFDIYNHYNSICDKPFQKFNPVSDII